MVMKASYPQAYSGTQHSYSYTGLPYAVSVTHTHTIAALMLFVSMKTSSFRNKMSNLHTSAKSEAD